METISDLTLANENHDIALKMMNEGYANKQISVSSYMATFVKLQPKKILAKCLCFEKDVHLVEENFCNLTNLGVARDSY